MVKALPGLNSAHLAGKKLQLAGAVFKRQRKLRTASGALCEALLDGKPSSLSTSVPQRKPDGNTEVARLAHTKRNHAAPTTIDRNNQKSPKGAQQLSRTALGVLQPHTLASVDSQVNPQIHFQVTATWGMAQEAQYFADLDTELLLEDEQDQPQTQPQDQDQQGHQQEAVGQDSVGHKRCDQNGALLQTLPMHHPALPTPDALDLAKYHPNLQAKYREYVCCMESSQSALTPMPLEDFCRLAGKGTRGLPVFNT
ncbi:hypothetical protein WJX77_002215 [Trebouxia sp. C0004]